MALLSWNFGIKLMGAVNRILFINFVPITAFISGVINRHQFSIGELIGTGLIICALIANNQYIKRTTI